MATDIELSDGLLRALRILAEHGEVREDPLATAAELPCIAVHDAEALGALYLADPVAHANPPEPSVIWWRIRSKGRQVLREHGVDA